jgi:hypothetical protein
MKRCNGFRTLAFAFYAIFLGLHPIVGWASTLLVTSGNTVGSYNPNTGAAINASLITGVTSPVGLAVTGSHLLVSSVADDTIGKYGEIGVSVQILTKHLPFHAVIVSRTREIALIPVPA